MKLTREQISNLTDVELNRAMVWLYPPCFDIDDYSVVIEARYEIGKVNYLSDYNLTMPLFIENYLSISPFYDGSGWVCDRWDGYSADKTFLRAICELLVMIAMEGMG
jgi:hypothetical protein